MDEALNFSGLALIALAALILFVEILLRKSPAGRLTVISFAALIAIFSGYILISLKSTTEVDFGKIGYLKRIVKDANIDAGVIAEIKKRAEQQGLVIDRATKQSETALEKASSVATAFDVIRGNIVLINKMINQTKEQILAVETQEGFYGLVRAASDDDRPSYDKLKVLSNDFASQFQSKAIAAVGSIYASHNQVIGNSFNTPWNADHHADTMSLDALEAFYNQSQGVEKLAVLQYITQNLRISKLQRAAFEIDVIKGSQSLYAVEIAVRGFDQATDQIFGALDIDGVLGWWERRPEAIILQSSVFAEKLDQTFTDLTRSSPLLKK